jgi:nucleoside-diphosphate-sugar epimerase
MHSPRGATLVTGATGFLGGLIAAKLLAEEPTRLVLPVRARHTRDAVLTRLAAEIAATGAPITSDLSNRVTIIPLPDAGEIPALAPALRDLGVTQIVHAAGCVDYFHTENLAKGNTDLTAGLVRLGQALRVERFEFISTAFSSGYRDGVIREAPHADAVEDPTEYTRSKRDAERTVIASGLPWVIARPSVVIGDSRDGRYGGKAYGLYQLWKAAEKLMCVNYLTRVYAIAPRVPLHVLHQDAFQNGFLAAHRSLPPGRIFHLVSREATLPTVRDVWDTWLMTVSRPREVYYFDRLADVPMEKLTRQQQMWVELTSVNLDISSRPWQFETTALDGLRAAGLTFADATPDTIAVCQARFVADSARVRTFLDKFQSERAAAPSVIEC